MARGGGQEPAAAAAAVAADGGVDESWDVVRSPTPPHDAHVSLGGETSPRFMVSDGRLRRMLHTATFVAPTMTKRQAPASSVPPLIVVMPPPRLTMDGAPLAGSSPQTAATPSGVDADVAALAALLVERFDAQRVAVISEGGAAVASAFADAGLQHLLLLQPSQ
jgi:riboflavin biosynthesis pyrimidine reductase